MLTLPVAGRPQETQMIPYSVKTKAADASNEQTSSKQELEQKQIENSNEE